MQEKLYNICYSQMCNLILYILVYAYKLNHICKLNKHLAVVNSARILNPFGKCTAHFLSIVFTVKYSSIYMNWLYMRNAQIITLIAYQAGSRRQYANIWDATCKPSLCLMLYMLADVKVDAERTSIRSRRILFKSTHTRETCT